MTINDQTLFDSIKGQEEEFSKAVYASVKQALIELGDDIYKTDWINMKAYLAGFKNV